MEKVVEINISDKRYPDKLKRIYNPPKKLYCIGDISLLNRTSIASVGSRNCTEYGEKVAFEIGKQSAINDVVLVSGMAKGVDSFSHLGCLRKCWKTIAVLGSGIDVCYPKENIEIY